MQACLMTCLRLLKAKRAQEVRKIAMSEIDMARENQWGYQKEMYDFWQGIGRRFDVRVKTGKFLTKDDLQIPWIRQATMGHIEGGNEVATMVMNGWDYNTAKCLVECFQNLANRREENA
jgi:hypothetical protein